MSNQNTYAPLPFSYLTGGNATRPTGFQKKAASQDDLDRVGRDQAPYSIYAGQAPNGSRPVVKRKESIDVIDPRLDVTDPYLLSTGAMAHNKGTSLQDLTDPYAEDPRYRDSFPSDAEAGNVFFRSPEGSDSSGKSPRPAETSQHQDQTTSAQRPHNNMTSLQRDGRQPGYTNPTLDTMTHDEDAHGKKLPRFKVADSNGFQYYTGNNDPKAKPLSDPPKSNPKDAPTPANPIWDKYYATGGLAPGYEGYNPTGPVTSSTPGIRPTTKEYDLNTLIRNSSSDSFGSGGCCKTKRAAVVTAVLLTALICLGAGFAAGWFIYAVVNGEDSGSTTAIPSATSAAAMSDTMAATTTTTTLSPTTILEAITTLITQPTTTIIPTTDGATTTT